MTTRSETTPAACPLDRSVMPRHPTIDECYAAGKGPEWRPNMAHPEGGLPNTQEERARFEAYMRGHCWDFGKFDEETRSYDTVMVRMLYGVWRDRGALPTVAGHNG